MPGLTGRVLIIGVTTNWGRELAAALVGREGVEVVGLDSERSGFDVPGVRFVEADLRSPSAIATIEEIDPELVEKARASFEELTRKEGKPEQAVPKIVEGRLNSWYGERVLPEQGVFGEKETVQQRLGEARIVRYAQAVIGS